MTRRSLAAVTAAMLLAACDWLPIGGGGDLDGAWQLVDGMHAGEAIPLVEDRPITMTIEGTQLGGTSGCNQYGGSFELDGSAISISALSMTEMACDEPIMAAEAAYLAALGAVDTVARADDQLTLSGPDADLRFEPVPPVPNAQLIGTSWSLDSLIVGDAVSSVMGEPATLELTDDGSIIGSTGCRGFGGQYTISDDTVEVGELVVDLRACDGGLAEQDEHVLRVLEGGFSVTIDGNRLTLMSEADGLGYVAAE
jgi:heat shock protein HslJ